MTLPMNEGNRQMQYPSLAELFAELVPPNAVPSLYLALADNAGDVIDNHWLPPWNANDESAPAVIPHLDELRSALLAAEERPISVTCSHGCCMGVPVVPYTPDLSPLPPSSRNKKRLPMDKGFMAASPIRSDWPRSATILMQVMLASLGRELANRVRMDDLTDRLHFAENIVSSMSSGFIVLLPDLTITHANPAAAELLQTTKEKLLSGKLPEFIVSDLKVRKVFKTGKPIVDEELFIKLPKATLHILKTAVPVFNDQGEVIAVLDHFRRINEAHQLVSRLSGTKASFTFDDIIYSSEAMGEAVELARMASSSNISVLINGESGTGKEMFAHAIHQASSRNNAPFVVIDCASMPRDLVESELFGYAEGAFTGAIRGGRPGKFELANGGTVFLDELGELPLELQSRLLRVLQNREVVRLGGAEPLPVDIRVIAATNRDLHEEVRQGNFRGDLFHRLNVLSIQIPPLRARPVDIATLAKAFLEKHKFRFKKPGLELGPDVLAALRERPWPGNARELDNTIVRAIQLCRDRIEPEHVRQTASPARETQTPEPAIVQPISLEEIERRAFKETVDACNGNVSRAARLLGVARSTVYKKLR
ncbi:sigma 54-interacting transcriptional regulator [Desulfovibrio sp. OttesenSCG-928-O18]|nr:sigma 54-interacting transcriptional regulator [Desulfovibrio sp. OttesenSCG-928-O18]